MTTKEQLALSLPFVEKEISRCRELSLRPGSDTDYWLEKMDSKIDMWIMGRDQLRLIEALES